MKTALEEASEDARYWHEVVLHNLEKQQQAEAEVQRLKGENASLWRRVEAAETALNDMLGEPGGRPKIHTSKTGEWLNSLKKDGNGKR